MLRSTFLTSAMLAAFGACANPPAAAPALDAVAPSSTVRIGAPAVNDTIFDATQPAGSIDLEKVSAEVERQLADLERCYRDRLQDTPELSGEVRIHWAISTEGEFEHGCISEDTVEDKVVSACVNELVAKGSYPVAIGQSVDVSVPFHFEHGG